MKQHSLGAARTAKWTWRREPLKQMETTVSWAGGTVPVDTLIAAPSSTTNSTGERDLKLEQSCQGQQWCFGMKRRYCVCGCSDLIDTLRGISGAVDHVVEVNSLVRPSSTEDLADPSYQDADEPPDARANVNWHIAMCQGKRRTFDGAKPMDGLPAKLESTKAGLWVRVEHPFRMFKSQVCYVKLRCRGLVKNIVRLDILFVLPNLWLVRRRLVGAEE